MKECYKPVLFALAKSNDSFLSMLSFRPPTSQIIITDNCNSQCITCSQWKNKSTNELTTEEIYDALAQLRELGVIQVYFSGGEPLLRHDLPSLVKRAAKLKFQSIAIMTNGLLLTESRATKLLESGLTEVGISIDGLRETHDYIRGVRGSFDKAISGLEILSRLRDEKYPHLKVTIATTLTKPTLSQLVPMTRLASTHQKFAHFNISLFDTSPYFFKDIDTSDLIIKDQKELDKVVQQLHDIKAEKPGVFTLSQTHQSFEYIRKYFTDAKRDDIPCVMGYVAIYIGPHGEVYHGCWPLEPVGNLREKKLEEIANSAEYRKRLKDMFFKRCPGCACGYKISLFYHLPSIGREVLWVTKSRIGSKP